MISNKQVKILNQKIVQVKMNKDIYYIDEIDINNKEEVIEWLINNIDEDNNEDIDDKVVELIISLPIERILKLDNYVRKHLQFGSKDYNPCCRGKYDTSLDCLPYCLGCNNAIARLRKYFHLIINLNRNYCVICFEFRVTIVLIQ